jgi:hypothetical protein
MARAAYRRLDCRIAQSLAVPDGYILRTPIALMNKGVITFGLSVVQSLLQRIEHKVCPHGAALTPTHDPTRIHVNHKGHVLQALALRDVGEVRHPQLIGPVCLDLQVDPVLWAWCIDVWGRGANDLAMSYTAQAQSAHQSLDSAAGNSNSLSVHLFPHLVGSVDRHIGVPDPMDLRDKFVILLGPVTAQCWFAYLGCMAPVTRRGDLQNLANRLDPIGIAVLVDVRLQLLSRRSSSAWAKNALAVLRMSLARRSSLTSRSKDLMR